MSYLIAVPDTLAATATDVASVGSSLSAANSAAAAPTTSLVAAAGDEVSTAIASLFSAYGKELQALSAQAAEFHSQFVQALNAGAQAYASTEAANLGPLQALVPNVAVSVGGHALVQLGSATASSVADELLPLNLAIALGANSNAASGGNFGSAIALGAGSHATTTGNIVLSSAFALGAGSDATVTGNAGGYVNFFPIGEGPGGTPVLFPVLPNIGDIAVALGPSSSASIVDSNFDFAIATAE